MVSKYYKIRTKSGANNSIKPFQLYLRVYGLAFGLFLNSAIPLSNIGDMPSGDHCAVRGCDNDRRYPEKQKILPHVGILRFYPPRNTDDDVLSWGRAINRDQFKVSMSAILYAVTEPLNVLHQLRTHESMIVGVLKPQRPSPKIRSTEN